MNEPNKQSIDQFFKEFEKLNNLPPVPPKPEPTFSSVTVDNILNKRSNQRKMTGPEMAKYFEACYNALSSSVKQKESV